MPHSSTIHLHSTLQLSQITTPIYFYLITTVNRLFPVIVVFLVFLHFFTLHRYNVFVIIFVQVHYFTLLQSKIVHIQMSILSRSSTWSPLMEFNPVVLLFISDSIIVVFVSFANFHTLFSMPSSISLQTVMNLSTECSIRSEFSTCWLIVGSLYNVSRVWTFEHCLKVQLYHVFAS